MLSASQRAQVLREVEYGSQVTGPVKRVYSISKIAQRHGIHENTIRRWRKQDMSQEAVVKRLSKRGRKRLLTADQESQIMDFCLQRFSASLPISGEIISNYAKDALDRELSRNYISRMMERNEWSSYRTQKRPGKRLRATYQKEVDDFREKYCIPLDIAKNYMVMDETGLWNDTVVAKSYAPNGHTAYIASEDRPGRDTLVACFRGDGIPLPPFYIQHRPKRKNQDPIKGMNEKLMLQWISEILKPNSWPGMTLFLDRLSSHCTKSVMAAFKELEINVVLLPAKTAPDLSPCDNFYFHYYKLRFNRLDRSTPEKKREAALAVYDEIPVRIMQACWRRCKLVALPEAQVVPDDEDNAVVDAILHQLRSPFTSSSESDSDDEEEEDDDESEEEESWKRRRRQKGKEEEDD